MIRFKVNGKEQTFDGDPDMPLLWYLRDVAAAHRNEVRMWHGVVRRMYRASEWRGHPLLQHSHEGVGGAEITTIEGIAPMHPVQKAWMEIRVPQCGYCQTGQIMQAIALLKENKNPSDQDIDTAMSGNLCRCGTYQRIRAAIHQAAKHQAAKHPGAKETA